MRYYFNLAGAVHNADNEGVDLSSMADARTEAVKFAAGYLADNPQTVWMGEEFRIEVTDGDRRPLFTFIAVGVDAPAREGRLRL